MNRFIGIIILIGIGYVIGSMYPGLFRAVTARIPTP